MLTRLFKTRNKVGSWLDWDISFFLSTLRPPPPTQPPMEGCPMQFLLSAPYIEDYIRGAQNVAGVLKKDRGCLLLLIRGVWGGGGGEGEGVGGAGKIECPILFSVPPSHFLFRSAAAKFYTERLLPGVKPLLFLRTPLWTEKVLLCHKFYWKKMVPDVLNFNFKWPML